MLRLEQRMLAKTASFTISPRADKAGQVFTNRGAGGSITGTLPSPVRQLKGWWYEFLLIADQTFVVAGRTAGDLIAPGNAAADNVSYATAANRLGRRILAFCDGTKWTCVGIGDGFSVNGTRVSLSAAEYGTLATLVVGVAAGYKLARGTRTQVAASDTVVTGLATVVAVVMSFKSAPTVKQLFCAADVGDQAGTPAAGSFLAKTYKPTAVNDVTPTAATDFTDNLTFDWVAIGT